MKTLSIALLLSITILTSQIFSQKTEKHNYSTSLNNKEQVHDNYVYRQFFFLVVNFEKESEKQTSDELTMAFRNYIQNRSNLNDEQISFLKTLSANFVSASSYMKDNEKLNYALLYKNEVKKFFGENEFQIFTKFLKDEIGSNLKIT